MKLKLGMIVVALFVLAISMLSASNIEAENNCDIECPVVEWTAKVCPQGYKENRLDLSPKDCHKGSLLNLEYAYFVDETFNVTYEKSQDPNKCHRPSKKQLEKNYNMGKNAVAFTQQNPELLDSIKVAPDGYELGKDGICRPIPTKTHEYKIVDAHKTCSGTDITVTTNSHREWRIGSEVVELGVHGGGVEDTHTFNDVPSDWLLEWSNVGKGDWRQADLNSESYTYNEYEADCELPEEIVEQTRNIETHSVETLLQAPQCTNSVPVRELVNPHVIRAGSEATVNAFVPDGDHVNIYFRTSGQDTWQHALRDIPVTNGFMSVTIHDLEPFGDYDFGIQASNGCAGGEIVAVIVDDWQPRTFSFTRWERL